MSAEDLVFRVVGGVALYFVCAIPFILLERWAPIVPLAKPEPPSFRSVLRRDVGAWLGVTLVGVPNGFLVEWTLKSLFEAPAISFEGAALSTSMAGLGTLSPWASFVLAFIASDFYLYWLHRWEHTGFAWRFHRWHHVPTYLYWFAGVRQSLPQAFLSGCSFAWFYALGVPVYLYPLALLLHLTTNHWIHTNWDVKVGRLDWILNTPDAHRLHHSKAERHRNCNFGVALIIWDRMFGTYVDPKLEECSLDYGIDEEPNPIRLAIGV